jgi:hypothetical protein
MNDSIQIYIDTKNASKYINNTSWCEFNIPNLSIDSQYHFALSVVNASIPYSFYNINSNNNTIQWIEDPYISFIVHQYSIPEGNYTINQLITTLNTLLSPLVLNYNSITNKITFTHPTQQFAFYNGNNTCFELLGLTDVNHFSSVGRVLVSDLVCNLFTVRSICVCSNYHTSNFHSNKHHMNSVLCNIPVNSNINSVILYENTNNFRNNLFCSNVDELSIKLLDQNANIINLNGAHWSMTLQFDIFRFVD